MTRINAAILAVAAAPFAFLAMAPAKEPGKVQASVSFTKQVKPLLKAKCYGCHNPDNPAGKLDVTTAAAIDRGGVSGRLIVAGKPDESIFLDRILGKGGKPRMPMGFPALTKDEEAIIRNWIAQGASTKETTVSFQTDIAPIIKAHCLSCHGSDQGSGGLNLSSGKSLAKGGGSGPVVVPGDPAKSVLLTRLKGLGGMPQMPLGFKPLTAAQIALVEKWILEGADTSDAGPAVHWAYQKPKRPALPPVTDKAWVKNPIDAFVLARLEKEGLSPSREADRETLIRRASLDLTGLPPTLDEIDAFLKDRSPNAYEKVVDRLLASPHYGERMARPWLDLARYADSNGYEKDERRVMWPWRDWVINAYNHNMPFDEFTVEQLAGDMLPNATQDQIVATGFNRNTMQNREGGVDQQEALFEVLIDRLSTTSTVWMGSTLACARCHDHKYDPFTQKDFYEFLAIFNNVDYEMSGDKSVGEEKLNEPTYRVITPALQAEMDAAAVELKAAQEDLARETPERAASRQAWVKQLAKPWMTPAPIAAESLGGTLKIEADGLVRAEGASPDKPVYTITYRPEAGTIRALRIEAVSHETLPMRGPGRSDGGNFVLSRVEAKINGRTVRLASPRASFVQGGYSVDGVLDDNAETGWAIYPSAGRNHVLIVELSEPLEVSAGDTLAITLTHGSQYPQHGLGAFRIQFGDLEHASEFAVDPSVAVLCRTRPEDPALIAAFRNQSQAMEKERSRAAKAEQHVRDINAAIPTTLVMRDRPATGPLKANLHIKGAFVSKGEEVEANIPGFLSAVPIAQPVNRLSLAKWLVHRDNPLTARTQVNRFWEMFFGRGIVESTEDLGTQASPPSHPELLDWLAVEFMDKGWDTKAVIKTIVMSATYRQSSAADRSLLEQDPNNILLARGPRFRMEAEMIRDNAYSVAGILNEKVGGPSVMPSQPEGIWSSPYNGDQWKQSMGVEANRRGLYTFWKRTAPYPSFLALDATSREACTVRRIRTNTPLQALALLNDDAMMTAARGLSRRMLAEAEGSSRDRVIYGFRLCTGRPPTEAEATRLVAFFTQMKLTYGAKTDEAAKLGSSPDEAAWTMVANVLLNLDETLTKG